MDDEERVLFLTSLSAAHRPPPDISEYMRQVFLFIIAIVQLPPDPLIDMRFRLFGDHINVWEGKDLFSEYALHPYEFFEATGETPESMLDVVQGIEWYPGRSHRLSYRNRVLLFFLWVRSYPSYHLLSLMFDIGVTTVHETIDALLPILYNKFSDYLTWPSMEEWNASMGNWPKLPNAVGAIDGTSHEIYRPITEPEQQYYSGHRHYHAIHTQVLVDNTGKIRYIETGFLGHQNDAQQYSLMRNIGNVDLPFPAGCFLLADKIYPNHYPLMTPYTNQQIARKDRRMKQKCMKLNKVISEYRIGVEHAIGELKVYKVLGTLWRHHRPKLTRIVMICAGLVCRRKDLFRM